MRLDDTEARRTFKRRMRERRENFLGEGNGYSQEEMAQYLQGKLDPDNPKYPNLRTYARWESENASEYLPPTMQKALDVARLMGFDVEDLLYPTEMPTQFFLARRLDTLVEVQTGVREELKKNNKLLTQILAALHGQ